MKNYFKLTNKVTFIVVGDERFERNTTTFCNKISVKNGSHVIDDGAKYMSIECNTKKTHKELVELLNNISEVRTVILDDLIFIARSEEA